MISSDKLLRELIAIPSVNPAFLPPGDPATGEQGMADFLAATAATAGLDIALEEVAPRRLNFFAWLAPTGKAKQRLLLAPHLDTVGEPGDRSTMFTPRQKAGRIYGRGACDTKGSVAAMLGAMMALAHQKDRPVHTEIVFVGLADEENGQLGSRALADSGFKANLAIVGEPTELQVVTAHKGNQWLRLQATGKPAHGARPELGDNAIHKMARVVHLLEDDYARALKKRRHPLLGRPTVNVGEIRGGTQPNIVPAQCSITIDRRTLPGETEQSVRREISQLLRKHGERVTIESIKTGPCRPMETDVKIQSVQHFLRIAGQRRPIGVDYFCDASVLSSGGIPSVVFGPGNIAQAHTADEWISIRSLEAGTQLLLKFLQSLP